MDITGGCLIVVTACCFFNAVVLLLFVLQVKKWMEMIKMLRKVEAKVVNPQLFYSLPEDYRQAIDTIIENNLGDESANMNDAFRAWQAEIYYANALAKDEKLDLKALELEALAFRAGWEFRK